MFSAPRDDFALIAAPSTSWNTLRRDVANANLHIHAISGTSNHLHLLLDLPSTRTVADVLRELKANSSARIRRKPTHFGWQNGNRVISVSPLAVRNVIGYINRR